MDRLTEIRQRTEAATPGPWNLITMGRVGDGDAEWGWIMGANKNWRWDDGDGPQSRANADFIAHSREDMEWLLTLADALKAQLASTLTRAEAAEARADAAAEDLKMVCISGEPCASCRECRNMGDRFPCALGEWCGGTKWQWRGQQAGKGEAE